MDYISRSCDLPKSENGNCLLSRSCDFPKKENLMAYISIFKRHFPKITKKGNLMAYVSRSHDLPKSKNGEQVGCLHNQVM